MHKSSLNIRNKNTRYRLLSKILSFFPFLLLLFHLHSSPQGIKFEYGLSWKEIKEKAKKENKFIFVDCFTTWCGPCKAMEKNVYSLNDVGDFYNKYFISIKVQMDKTKEDKETIIRWRADADDLKNMYKIEAFPTFLFFSADGNAVHKIAGAYDGESFIKIGRDAINPSFQYYTLLKNYTSGKMDTAIMKTTAKHLNTYGRKELGALIAADYLNMLPQRQLAQPDNLKLLQDCKGNRRIDEIADRYISNLTPQEMYLEHNIDLINTFTSSSKDKTFNIFYLNVEKINTATNNQDYAQKKVENIIYEEEVKPVFMHNMNNKIASLDSAKITLSKKYNAYYGDRVISRAKMDWYNNNSDKRLYAQWLVYYVDHYGPDVNSPFGDFVLNNYAWEVFEISTKRDELEKALIWSNKVIQVSPAPNWIDTKANILYKLGKKQEAITLQKMAIRKAKDIKDPQTTELQKNLTNMEAGVPTWPTSHN